MACNTPIIASFDTESEVSEILKSSKAGVCIEPEDARTLANTILEAKNRDFEFSNGSEYVMSCAERCTCQEKYLRIFSDFS